jgi:hypothetical protein
MKNGQNIRLLITLPVLGTIMPCVSQACPVCTGGPESPVAPALNGAIFLLLGVIGTMFAGLGVFAYVLYRRSKSPAPAHEGLAQMIYQEGTKHHA